VRFHRRRTLISRRWGMGKSRIWGINPNSPLFERGQFIDENGYARYKDTNKLVHRHVAEKYIVGRKLLSGEDVHHKNRNKLDNRIENLQVMNHENHMLMHALHGEHTGSYIWRKLFTSKKRY
jgi:hypothetical protein